MLDFKLEKTSNDLRIISSELKNTKAVTILILVKTGSRYEQAHENGIAHFLEHIFFKGTYKRPKTLDIAKELDGIGASYNAFTAEEYTGFYIRAESSHFNLALDMLSDMLTNSKFEQKEIQKEKGVILEEINMINDQPQAHVEYILKELLWKNQPLGRTITGIAQTVTNFNRKNFTAFFDNFYQANNIIITVAGGKSQDKKSLQDWTREVEKTFKKISNKKTPEYEKAHENQTKPELKIYNKKTDQSHFIIGFRALKYKDERRSILKVLNNIMGATMSSRLFTEVREKRGLCYYISSDVAYYEDTGFWGVSAGVDIKKTEEALKVIVSEFQKILNKKVSSEELLRAKENLKGHLYLSLEESMNVAQLLAEQEMFLGKIKDPDEIAKEIDKVSKEDIQKLDKDIFLPGKLNLAIIGPFKEEEKFKKILNEF